MLAELFQAIAEVLNPPPPDPKRFCSVVPHIPNFKGELIGVKAPKNAKDRVQIYDDGTVTFFDNSGFSGMNITGELTESNREGLKARGYQPNNPAYQKAKAFFAINPSCNKRDLAAHCGLSPDTCKDVLAVFNSTINR